MYSQALKAPHHIYSYAPYRPTLLRKWMPDSDSDVTWKWIKEALPSMTETALVYDLANMLSKPSQCTLSKLESPTPQFKSFHKVFKQELSKLSDSIKRRNHEYDYLDPEKVACSIDV